LRNADDSWFWLSAGTGVIFMENTMRNYLYVFCGGAAGGLLRVMATRADNIFHLSGIDLTILVINLAGAFLLGLFLSGSAQFESFSPGLRLAVSVGFFGSFTTFSTFCMESIALLHENSVVGFVLYAFSSCFLGLIVSQLGYLTGKGAGLFQSKVILEKALVSGQQETEGD